MRFIIRRYPNASLAIRERNEKNEKAMALKTVL